MEAETAYLFRHAIVRDAAYELQTPGNRGRLHALALDVFEQQCGGTPALESPRWLAEVNPHPSDPHAAELAAHAELAAAAIEDADELLRKSAIYLRRAAYLERAGFRNFSALKFYARLFDHRGADDFMRADAHLSAGQMHYRHGAVPQAEAEYLAASKLISPEDEVGVMLVKISLTIVRSHYDNGPHVAESHRAGAEFWKRVGDTRRQLASLINFAVWHCEEGDKQVAREALVEAIRVASEQGYRRGEEAALGTLALLDGNLGRSEEAEAGLRRAIEIAADMGNRPSELTWISALAESQRDRGMLDSAEKLFLDVKERARQYGLEARVDYSDAGVASVLVLAGRVDEAREIWNAAWARLQAHNDEYACRTTRVAMEMQLKKAGLAPLQPDGTLGR